MQIDIVLEPDSPARFAELAALAESYDGFLYKKRGFEGRRPVP